MTKTGLKLFDTKAREILDVPKSNDDEVRIYCCGPTVYRDAHVGNLRTFLLSDLVVRTLNFLNHKTKLIQNITDVGHMGEDFEGNESGEDKMISEAKKEARDPFEIAREFEAKFHADLAHLNIKKANAYPRASETIDLMLGLISKLIANGHAYVGSDDCVYFDAQTFPSYGAISGNKLDSLKPGHRYDYVDDGAKKFHADWALWKAAGNRTQMIWQSPWGPGFPGWHIECSAMSLDLLSGEVDLHLGGIDLRFPHHENERAQSNSAVDREVVSNWVHGEHLLFEGRKMSKSAGNVVLLSDLIAREIDPLALRLCFLENRYRSQMDLTWDSIHAANTNLNRWREKFADATGEIEQEIVAVEVAQIALDFNSDLDTPRAILKLRKLEKSIELSPATKRAIVLEVDKLFGLNLDQKPKARKEMPTELSALLEARSQARANKDFAQSDLLRDELLAAGISVRDTQEGQVWDWA
jgi:cysteinyl-tRNA synthetase